MNSGPLSLRRKEGHPLASNNRFRTRMTSSALKEDATSIAMASLVNSSVIVRHFTTSPFMQLSWTKS